MNARGKILRLPPNRVWRNYSTGRCTLHAGGETHQLGPGEKVFAPAGLGPLEIKPAPACTLLECYPPAA